MSYQPQHYEPKHRLPRVFLPLVIVGLLGFAVAGYLMLKPHGYQPQNPVAYRQCVNAWVKIHDDGVTSQVLDPKPDQSAAANLIMLENLKDVARGDVCGSLSHEDDVHATAEINKLTGDNYVAGH